MVDKKILGSADESEIEEALGEEIYTDLLRYAERFGNNQAAVDKMQIRLQKLILASPHNAGLIKRVAEKAGLRFLKVVGEAKRQDKILSNLTVKQTPPREKR